MRAISVRRTVYDHRIGVVVLWRPIARCDKIIGEKALTGLTICVCDTFSYHNHRRNGEMERTCRFTESAILFSVRPRRAIYSFVKYNESFEVVTDETVFNSQLVR